VLDSILKPLLLVQQLSFFQGSNVASAGSRLSGLGVALLLTACVSSDLTPADSDLGTAVLELYPMSSSQNSTRCLITHIDGKDMRDRQSPRLTVSYIVPAGEHLYQLNCEDSVGSIPVRAYSFLMPISLVGGGNYVLLKEYSARNACIVVRESGAGKNVQEPIAEYCSLPTAQGPE
jgi:hypothetical protein